MDPHKRPPSPALDSGRPSKKPKKQWHMPKKSQTSSAFAIEPGDAGIWATCNMHKESRATVELRDLLEESALRIYGEDVLTPANPREGQSGSSSGEGINSEHSPKIEAPSGGDNKACHEGAPDEEDVEASIARELSTLQRPKNRKPASDHPKSNPDAKENPTPLFRSVKLSTACLLFFKTRPPVEPVSFVRAICQEAASQAASEPRIKGSRFLKRLTPITRVGKATVGGLEQIGREVLEAAFGEKTGLKVRIWECFLPCFASISYGLFCPLRYHIAFRPASSKWRAGICSNAELPHLSLPSVPRSAITASSKETRLSKKWQVLLDLDTPLISKLMIS